MTMSCPACSHEFNAPGASTQSSGLLTCPACGHRFEASATSWEQAVHVDVGNQASNARFFVKRPTGKVFGPFDQNAIEMMLKADKIDGRAQLSRDKQHWFGLAEIPNLAKYAAIDAPDANPRSTVMGGWNTNGGQDAAQHPNLPRPAQRADLPASSQKAPPSLPRSAKKAPPSLPQSAQRRGDLPTSAASSNKNLPRSTSKPPLPTSASGGQSAEDDLFGAPSLDDVDELFSAPSLSETDFLKGSEVDFLDGPDDEDDLFAAPDLDDEDDLFAAPDLDDEDDLFAAPDLDDEDDLFAAPDLDDEDDLFAAPDLDDEDDLFAAPSPSAPPGPQSTPRGGAPIDDGDLFGAAEGDQDDLFAAAAEDESMFGDDDDFLGGRDGFSFLDDEQPTETDDAWGEDLMGNQPPQQDTMGAESAAPIDPPPAHEDGPSEPAYDDDDPFRPASRGLQQPESSGAPTQTDKKTAVEEDKKRGIMNLVGVPLVALLVLGGLGYAGYSAFVTSNEPEEPAAQPKKAPAEVNLTAVASGNHATLLATITQARSGELSAETEGKLLATEALFLSRYEDTAIAAQAAELADKHKDADAGWPALGRGAWEAQAGRADAARAYLEPIAAGELAYFANLVMGIGDVKAIEAATANDDARAPSPDEPAQADDALTVEATAPSENEGAPEDASPDEGDPAQASDEEVLADAPGEEADSAESPDEAAASAPAESVAAAQADSNVSALAERARAALSAAAAAEPHAEPLFWLGRMEAALGNQEQAISAWRRAVDTQLDHVASRLALAEAEYAEGELNAASEQLAKITAAGAEAASPNELARAWHYTGMLDSARRRSDQAINALTKALSLDASRTDTLRALAEEYERSRKYEEALNFFTTNKSLGQNDPEVMLGIVRSNMGMEQWDQAIAKLQAGEKQFPEDARFPYYLGQLNLRRGAFFDARAALKRAVDIDPTLLLAHAKLAQIAWRVDEDAQAGQDSIEALSQYPDMLTAEVATEVATFYRDSGNRPLAEEWLKSAMKLDPNFWQARLSLSRLLLERGEDEDALALLERALEEGVEDSRLSAYLADAYRQSEKYDRAIDQINRVIKQFDDNEEYIFIRGRIYFDRGNFDNATQDFNKAYELNPRYHRAYFYAGRTAFEQADYETATRIFRHVLDYRNDNGEFHYWMGRTYEAQKRIGQALEQYRRASAVDEAYAIRNPELFIRRGRLLARLGYSSDGRKDIERALQLAPEMDEALIAMGETNFNDKLYDDAIENFGTALAKNPERPDAQYKLGMSLLYTGEDKKGVEHLQKAVRHGYEDPEVYRTLGYKYKELGQRDLAVESFKAFLAKSSERRDVPEQTKREMIDQIQALGASL